MKKLLSLFFLVCLPWITATAEDIDGILYNLDPTTKEATVIDKFGGYSGNVVIPDIVYYDSVEYRVTRISEFAFSDAKALISIKIGNNVKSI